jgi:hypothetical protein
MYTFFIIGKVYDLAAKIWPESDPVYDLTAIDTNKGQHQMIWSTVAAAGSLCPLLSVQNAGWNAGNSCGYWQWCSLGR